MIRVKRCAEPANLSSIRSTQLLALRALGREPKSDEINGYRIVAEDLWKSQYHKCCYCEARIPKGFNDVEHYRPKAVADRKPGCSKTHGYWWLAFSWDNLLFACPGCNRSYKNSRFPLNLGCQSLAAEESPPGNEIPLLIDPTSPVNPVEHIEFVYQSIGHASSNRSWWARPRNGSLFGNATIEVCGLNRSELREIREDYFATVILPQRNAIESAIGTVDLPRLKTEVSRALELLTARNEHVGLTYDALRHLVPNDRLQPLLGAGWPAPSQVAI